ncbi:MAG: ABC transporter substrate-binding protein [Armatimonadota bacterium]|nr:MAG: ABC transporter substrate-binding protein [Armatimonadota bacterium]
MRALRVICLTLAVVVVICGCARRERGAQPGAGKLTIAVVPKAVAFDFWLSVKAGADQAAEENDATIIWRGPSDERDVAGQISMLEDLINSRVDGIVMAACDSKALAPIVRRAAEAKIPLITIDSGVDDPSVPLVATDNIRGARIAGETLVELIGGKGKVGLIPFVAGAATSTMRENGFKEEIKKHPQVEIVSVLYSESDAAKGMAVTENMLTSNPDLAGIFAANEPGAIGAARAIEQRGLAGKVKLVAFDAADSQIAALERGTIQALIVQNPFKMGYEGVQTVVKAIRGEPVPRYVDTGVSAVTKENLDTPEIKSLLGR